MTKMPESFDRSVIRSSGDAVGEMDLFGIGAKAVERQHGDGWFVRQRQGCAFDHDSLGLRLPRRPPHESPSDQDGQSGCRRKVPLAEPSGLGTPSRTSTIQPDAVGPHRARDVLDVLLASEFQGMLELAMQMIVGRAGDENPARVAQLLQAGGDVHAIAEKIAVLDDDVAQVDADPEHDATVRRNLRLMRGDLLLHRNGKGCSVHDRTELGNRAITHQFDDAAVMLGQQRIDDLAPQGLDGVERAILVTFSEAGIADDVRSHDCRQPALDLVYPITVFQARSQTPGLALRMPGASHPAIRSFYTPCLAHAIQIGSLATPGQPSLRRTPWHYLLEVPTWTFHLTALQVCQVFGHKKAPQR